MRTLELIAGLICLLTVVVDAFQTIILPRRPSGRFRLTRFFFIASWPVWRGVARRMKDAGMREKWYSVYGPLSILLLLAMWAALLVVGFALVYAAAGSPFGDAMMAGRGVLESFKTDLYVSGTTLFTLGLGDVVPRDLIARGLIVSEAGMGLGFVALVIGYVPVLYGAFSRREVTIALLDARAGSPPTATELLRRHSFEGGDAALVTLLEEWERWSAEILESHISYPTLCYYRSQHDNQSWLSALTAVLDACAVLISNVRGLPSRQAQLTFVMARHALIDLRQVFHLEPMGMADDRLAAAMFGRMCGELQVAGVSLCGDAASVGRLREMRALYEPHAEALSFYLQMPLPPWVAEPKAKDNWRMLSRVRAEAETAVGAHSEFGRRGEGAEFKLHDDDHAM